MKSWRLSLLLLLVPAWLSGQVLNNASLTGKFYFVHLLAEVSPSAVTTNAHTLSGTITFDGNGGFALDGKAGSGEGAAIPAFANGPTNIAHEYITPHPKPKLALYQQREITCGC